MSTESPPLDARPAGVPSESLDRLPGPDVTRAVALIGVAVMNYHGYLILRGGERGEGALADLFDPWRGPLSTRFAATFVLVAGVGVTLLTRRVVAARDAGEPGADAAVVEMRWRLVRRGLVLYLLGQFLDVIWPGTIILYYGLMFVVAAALFTLAARWILAIGAVAVLSGWAIRTWRFWRVEDGEDPSWLTSPDPDSVRNYVFEVMVNGTHPLLPWLGFFCVGIVLGRVIGRSDWQLPAVGVGLTLAGVAAMVSDAASTPFQAVLLSRHPGDRGLVYTMSALGTAVAAFAVLSWLAERATERPDGRPGVLDPLRRAGQMSLTIYVGHILVFNLVVDWLGWIEPGGLATALAFSLGYWAVAIALAAWWHHRFGRGPLERVYRHLGG